MRVMMVTGEYPPMGGGIAGYTELLRKTLQSRHVNVVVASAPGTEADVIIDRWSWPAIKRIATAAENLAVDAIHIQYQAGAFDMHPAINLLPRLVKSRPVVTTFHDLRVPYLFPKAGRARYALMRRMARWSDATIVTNAADQRILSESRIESERIPLGPSLPMPEPGTTPDHRVGFFGYPSRQKGFDRLLDAVSIIEESERPDVLIVGSLPPTAGSHGYFTRSDVEQMARARHVTVRWTGHMSPQAASNALGRCGAIAFPFPAGATLRSSALLATLNTGRPIVTSRPSRPEDLDGLDAMPQLHMVDPDSIVELAAQLRALLSKLHESSTSRLPAVFQWDLIATRHAELYRSLVNERGS